MASTVRAGDALAAKKFLDPLRIRRRKLATFFPDGWNTIHHAPQSRAVQTARPCKHLNHLSCELTRLDFRVQRRDDFFENFERRSGGGFRRGFPLHTFPLYWITRIVMSSDCGAPSVNAFIPSRIASPN